MENKLSFIDYQKLFNDNLCKYIPESDFGVRDVHEAMNYSLTIGGKRIRPIIVLESCRICGGNLFDAMPFAAAIEMIHTYSLIHDDLPCMDDDDLRRGKPTCHKAFGEAFAVLAGDALLTEAFKIVSTSDIAKTKPHIAIKAIEAISKFSGANGMIGGQVLDLKNENSDVSVKQLDLCNSLKTGALIRCSTYLGAVCADAENEYIQALDNYAACIGKAFQIIDDILNVSGDENILGKPIGTDSSKGKSTYTSLMTIDEAKILAEELTYKAVGYLDCFGNESYFLKNLAFDLIRRKK